MKKKVTILQHRLLHYRMTLFERLRDVLNKKGIELTLVHGQASPSESIRNDEGYLPWAEKITNRFKRVGGTDLCWQSLPKNVVESDLIILMQENRLLSNYPLMIRRWITGQRLVYWGHGINFQSTAPNGFREKIKSMLIHQVDWWFAYTDATVKILADSGYPLEKITCLNNAIDTSGFKNDLKRVNPDMRKTIQNTLGLEADDKLGLFCGSIYPDKRPKLLIDAADLIHDKIKNFHFIVIGDGPSKQLISDASKSRPWLHWVGVQKGIDKAAYYNMADVILNPGLVGLHILDAFVAGLPMISTTTAKHSPEIVYLNQGKNGFLTPDTPAEYSQAVINLFQDEELYASVSAAALASSKLYTLDHMVTNFANGIEQCLEQAP